MAIPETNGQRSRSGFASTLALVLAAVAVVSSIGMFVVNAVRDSRSCETVLWVLLASLIWTALVSSILAVIAGIVALVVRSDRLERATIAIALGIVGGALVLVAVNTFFCSVGAA